MLAYIGINILTILEYSNTANSRYILILKKILAQISFINIFIVWKTCVLQREIVKKKKQNYQIVLHPMLHVTNKTFSAINKKKKASQLETIHIYIY